MKSIVMDFYGQDRIGKENRCLLLASLLALLLLHAWHVWTYSLQYVRTFGYQKSLVTCSRVWVVLKCPARTLLWAFWSTVSLALFGTYILQSIR
jgi:hypothetical protein